MTKMTAMPSLKLGENSEQLYGFLVLFSTASVVYALLMGHAIKVLLLLSLISF